MGKIKKDYFFVVAIVLSVALYLNRALLPGKDEIIYGGDLLSQFYYWKGFLASHVREGLIPFWNPYNFSGTPFLAHPATSAFYPFTLLFLVLPLNLSFSIFYFVHLAIGGLGIYFLVRKYASVSVSFVSSLAFMLSGYFSARIYAGHIDLLSTAVWIPWVIYSLNNIAATPTDKRSIRLGIASFVLLILAGYSAYLLFTLGFTFFFLVFGFLKNRGQGLRIFKSTLFVMIVGLGLTAVQWLPVWQLTGNSIRGGGLPYELASWGSLPVSGLKLFFDPLNRPELDKITFNLGGGPVANPFDHFPGRFPVLIIISFLMVLLLQKLMFPGKKMLKVTDDFWLYFAVSLFFLFVSFGSHLAPNLHRFLYGVVPLYRFIRIPMQNLIIPVVLIPVMLGIALSKLRNGILLGLLAVVIILELINFDRDYIFPVSRPGLANVPEAVRMLKSDADPGRVFLSYRVSSPAVEKLDFNSSMSDRFESASGYDPVILKNYYDYMDKDGAGKSGSLPFYNVEIPPVNPNSPVLDMLNVRWIVGEDGKIEENRDYKPRFYFRDNPGCDPSVNKISLKRRSLNKISLDVISGCRSELVTAEVGYPGWKAKIDGKDTKITLSDGIFRTVSVREGVHLVEFYYSPDIYIIGLLISLLSGTFGFFGFKRFYS